MMDFFRITNTRRSIRQFRQEPLDVNLLRKCVHSASLAPSAANKQPLRYILVTRRELCESVFPLLKWAGYIQPDGNPRKGFEPTAYLVILVHTEDQTRWSGHDAGAAVENFLLTIWSQGIGSCWIASVDRTRLSTLIPIPEGCKIDSIVALGYPAEEPIQESNSETIRYWKDKQNVLHVPKLPLDEILTVM